MNHLRQKRLILLATCLALFIVDGIFVAFIHHNHEQTRMELIENKIRGDAATILPHLYQSGNFSWLSGMLEQYEAFKLPCLNVQSIQGAAIYGKQAACAKTVIAKNYVGQPILRIAYDLPNIGLASTFIENWKSLFILLAAQLLFLSFAYKVLSDIFKIHAEESALNRIATQLAHDIRSPLAALEVVSADAAQLPEEEKNLIHGAVGRIRDIANSLLDRHRVPAAGEDDSPQMLSSLIESLLAEKRLQFRSLTHVKIEAHLDDSSSGIFAEVQPAEFKRLLSNLINNAVEAVGEGPGVVRVTLLARDRRALVNVQDDGRGISPEILDRLGRRGETHGKIGGSGLGLYHARTSVESWGGRLEIASTIGKGATMTVDLPQAPTPDWFRMGTPASTTGPILELWDAILIDDDPLARMTWKMGADRAGKKLRVFSTASDFLKAADEIDRETPVYVDAELADGAKGEAESRRIHELGFGEVYLATGHEPGKFAGLTYLRGVVGKNPPWG